MDNRLYVFTIGCMFRGEYYKLTKQILMVTLLFSVTRLLFYFFNIEYFANFSMLEVLLAFLYGLRFDLATACIGSFIPLAIYFFPIELPGKRLLGRLCFILLNWAMLAIAVIDIEYFKFIGKKMTADVFGIATDVWAQTGQLILNYWYLVLLLLCYGFVLVKVSVQKRTKKRAKKYPWIIHPLLSFVYLVLCFIGVRGGLQLRSISPKEAFVHKHFELGNLTLNAAYTLVRSLEEEQASLVNYFPSDKDALLKIRSKRSFGQSEVSFPRANIVVLIMESFSTEYFKQGYMPYLEKLSKKGAFFERNMANGRRSIEALPAIFSGIPVLQSNPLSQSSFQANRFYPLPLMLKKNGYETAFFHGGKKGTMDFDAYTASIGFDQYFSLSDYPNKEHFDGQWGIYDHYFFDFFKKKLDQFKGPFLAGFFSLSSHQPYAIPTIFEGKYKKGELEIHESIQYADDSLRMFFESIQDSPWYSNTLFIITGDHTSKLGSNAFENTLGRYRVPLLFYHPSTDLSSYSSQRIVQHVDILPTILDALKLIPEKRLYFGSSVFNNDRGRSLHFNGHQYIMVTNDQFISLDKNSHLYSFNEDMSIFTPYQDKEMAIILEEELKAYIQYYHNGLIRNNIYDLLDK